ncbi:hypothetical protein FM113_06490 [Leucobacter sp. 7(1)]|uniref:hypothetical protein n=1 Tax=Leucobacter sp. 7(1) TaxID=1255613 RepID=UPI00097F3B3D|nr:hypothetical protein [Leucobacter sp. 7(1)]SJN09523.1 hypothetical protein FM113_06490 [Leucobacter sp. 7(1)]
MTETPKKKVVRVEQPQSAEPAAARTSTDSGPAWTPSPESKAKATRLRIISWIAWGLAIGVQAFAIFWILKQVPVNMWLLIGAIVVTGILSVAGSLCWKQANRLDPASERDKVKFFIQNQLGAIMSIVSFLPLIIMIFLNKNMNGKQKALAGGIGIVVLLIAAAFGVSYQSPSQEQYAAETNIIEQLTGQDEVFWTKSGSVFHVCDAVPDVNKESKDGTIYRGTVAAAHEAGKDRLTLKWENEATKYCGFTQEQVDAVNAAVESPATSEAPAEEAPAEEVPAE